MIAAYQSCAWQYSVCIIERAHERDFHAIISDDKFNGDYLASRLADNGLLRRLSQTPLRPRAPVHMHSTAAAKTAIGLMSLCRALALSCTLTHVHCVSCPLSPSPLHADRSNLKPCVMLRALAALCVVLNSGRSFCSDMETNVLVDTAKKPSRKLISLLRQQESHPTCFFTTTKSRKKPTIDAVNIRAIDTQTARAHHQALLTLPNEAREMLINLNIASWKATR